MGLNLIKNNSINKEVLEEMIKNSSNYTSATKTKLLSELDALTITPATITAVAELLPDDPENEAEAIFYEDTRLPENIPAVVTLGDFEEDDDSNPVIPFIIQSASDLRAEERQNAREGHLTAEEIKEVLASCFFDENPELVKRAIARVAEGVCDDKIEEVLTYASVKEKLEVFKRINLNA